MADRRDTIGRFFVFGVNHRSAAPALRERLLMDIEEHAGLLEEIGAHGLEEALVLATCDRLEIAALDPAPETAPERLVPVFARRGAVPVQEIRAQSYHHLGEAALRHLFAVASSLDSQIIGEPQVLGQVKQCHRLAAAAGLLGAELEPLLQAAYGTAKRVRAETAVAERPVSIAASAVMVARDLHGDLARCQAALVGLGEMGDFMALELQEAGLEQLTVLHGSLRRAEAAARRLGCHFRPLEELPEALVKADIVVTATGAGRHTVTEAMVAAALKSRRNKPILAIDAAVPGDVEPSVDGLEDAFVYDLDDLESVAREGQANREAVASEAWRILDDSLAAFLLRRAERAAVPTVTALRGHFEAVRREVLDEGRQDAAAATKLLIARLLHDPSETLRALAAEDPEQATAAERAIKRLFRLDRGVPPPDEEKES